MLVCTPWQTHRTCWRFSIHTSQRKTVLWCVGLCSLACKAYCGGFTMICFSLWCYECLVVVFLPFSVFTQAVFSTNGQPDVLLKQKYIWTVFSYLGQHYWYQNRLNRSSLMAIAMTECSSKAFKQLKMKNSYMWTSIKSLITIDFQQMPAKFHCKK